MPSDESLKQGRNRDHGSCSHTLILTLNLGFSTIIDDG
jgi:hypothetical protein